MRCVAARCVLDNASDVNEPAGIYSFTGSFSYNQPSFLESILDQAGPTKRNKHTVILGHYVGKPVPVGTLGILSEKVLLLAYPCLQC